MQRQTYPNPPPAHSPPLHHPVPQHVSTVPQLRSPPPPVPQPHLGSNYGAFPGQQPAGASGAGPGGAGPGVGYGGFNNFINDPTAQMSYQLGKNAVMAGQDYVEQNFNRWVNVGNLKHYFNVSNSYVVSKLLLVIFPWRHKPWSRQQRLSHSGGPQEVMYLPPREDINSPDMYIPLMALVTYILLSTLLAGLRQAFHPELFGMTATTAFVVVALEIMILRLAMYLLSISNESQLLDLVAYSGYKFVGVIVTLLVAEVWNRGGGTGGWVGWAVFFYTFSANAFFLVSESTLFRRTNSNSCGRSNTFCCPTLHPTQTAVHHTQPTGGIDKDGHSFCSFTPTLFNLSLCGS
jgi:protein transport protein YIF1